MIKWESKGSQRIAQNARNLIALQRHELPFCRRWGIDPELVDSRENDARPRAISEAYQVVSSGEPRAVINDIGFNGARELVVSVSC